MLRSLFELSFISAIWAPGAHSAADLEAQGVHSRAGEHSVPQNKPLSLDDTFHPQEAVDNGTAPGDVRNKKALEVDLHGP